MRALIGIGGTLKDRNWIRTELNSPGFDLIVAADSGADHLLELGLVPDVFLGDMDSVSNSAKQQLRDLDIDIIEYNIRKDGSDTELAIEEAVGRGADQIVLLGSFSLARPDHLMANIMMLEGLKRQHADLAVCLTDGLTFVTALMGPIQAEFSFLNMPDIPYVVSLLPISREVTGLSYEGLGYDLTEATLERGTSRGISNYAIDRNLGFSISLNAGSAVLFLTPEE